MSVSIKERNDLEEMITEIEKEFNNVKNRLLGFRRMNKDFEFKDLIKNWKDKERKYLKQNIESMKEGLKFTALLPKDEVKKIQENFIPYAVKKLGLYDLDSGEALAFITKNLPKILKANEESLDLNSFFANPQAESPLIEVGTLKEYIEKTKKTYEERIVHEASSFFEDKIVYRPLLAEANLLALPVSKLSRKTIFRLPKERELAYSVIEDLSTIDSEIDDFDELEEILNTNDPEYSSLLSIKNELKLVDAFTPKTRNAIKEYVFLHFDEERNPEKKESILEFYDMSLSDKIDAEILFSINGQKRKEALIFASKFYSKLEERTKVNYFNTPEDLIDAWTFKGADSFRSAVTQPKIYEDLIEFLVKIMNDPSTKGSNFSLVKNIPEILNINEISNQKKESKEIFKRLEKTIQIIENAEKPIREEWDKLEKELGPNEFQELETVDRMYGPGSFFKFNEARANLTRIPVHLLTTENLFGPPLEHWPLFKDLFINAHKSQDYTLLKTLFKENKKKMSKFMEDLADKEIKLKEPQNTAIIAYWYIQDKHYKEIGSGVDYNLLAKRVDELYIKLKNRGGDIVERFIPFNFEVKEKPYFDTARLKRYLDAVLNEIDKKDEKKIKITLKLDATEKSEAIKIIKDETREVIENIRTFMNYYYQTEKESGMTQEKLKRNNIKNAYTDWMRKERSGNVPKEIRKKLKDLKKDFFDDKEIKKIISPEEDNLLLEKLSKKEYFNKELEEAYTDALNSIRAGLDFKINFNTFAVESSDVFLQVVNSIGDCCSIGGNKEEYGLKQGSDPFFKNLIGTIYEGGNYKDTIGKAFMLQSNDEEDIPLLYVDGVIVFGQVAHLLRNKKVKEQLWMPMFTKGIIQTAIDEDYLDIIFNTQHKDAQYCVWQYCEYIADLFNLKKGRDYSFEVQTSNDGKHLNKTTTNKRGFKLNETREREDLHWIKHPIGTTEHFLSGFWINNWNPNSLDSNVSEIPKYVWESISKKGREPRHKEHGNAITESEGYVLGIRKETAECIDKFYTRYGEIFGKFEGNNLDKFSQRIT